MASRAPASNDTYDPYKTRTTTPTPDPYAGLANNSGGSPGAGAYSSLGAATNEALGTPSPEHTDSAADSSFGGNYITSAPNATGGTGGAGFMAGDSGAFGGEASQRATRHAAGQNGANLQLGLRSPFQSSFGAGNAGLGRLTGMGLGAGTTTDEQGNTTSVNGQGGNGSNLDSKTGDSKDGDNTNPSPNYEAQSADMWANMLAGQNTQHQQDIGAAMDQSYRDEARAGRVADVQSAMLGQGVSGGGYQGGQAQVQLGGMQQRQDSQNKIDQQYYHQGLTMKMAYLETLIKRAEASKDRALQDRLQAEADKTQLLIAGGGIDTTNYNKPTSQMNLLPG